MNLPAPDAIHPKPLKEIAEQLGRTLEIIYNSTVENGTTSNDWRQAHITAMFNKGSM